MSLHCLVYVSLATKDMQDKELRGMLKAARAKNERLGVTGMLLYRDGFFIQALEGEEETIDTLFARIATDSRHRDVTLVYKKPISQRGFPDWTMGFSRMTEGELEKMEGYSDFLQNPTPQFFTARPSYAQSLLENFKADLLF